MAATIINRQIEASISDCEIQQEKLAKEQVSLEKKIASLQNKLRAAAKRRENAEKYISSLMEQERVIEIHSDEKILSGTHFNHYVRSESLNQYPGNNYYYIVTMRKSCTCDARGHCKHVEALAARLSDGEKAAKFASLKAQYDCRKPVRQTTSKERQESVLAGASRAFSLYR